MNKMKFKCYCYNTLIVLFFTGIVFAGMIFTGIVMISCNPNGNLLLNYNTPPDTQAIEIRTPADLQLLASNPSATFHIKNDIDMSGVAFTPIPSFRGTLDGKQHIIKNLTVVIPSTTSESHLGGFIKETSGRVTIKNLAFHNFSMDVNKDGVFGLTEAGRIVGGLIGHVKHDTTISHFALKGNISTSYHTGGLVGAVKTVDFIVDTSYVITQITTTRTSIMTGGLMHQADHRFTIKDTYIAGVHTSPATSFVYHMQNAIVSLSTKRSSAIPFFENVYWNVYWKRYSLDTLYRASSNNLSNEAQRDFRDYGITLNGELKSLFTSGINISSDISLHTDDAMKVQANFKNWDFDGTWVMGNSYRGYPQFQWEVVE